MIKSNNALNPMAYDANTHNINNIGGKFLLTGGALIITEKTRKDPRRPEKTRKDPKRPEKTRKDALIYTEKTRKDALIYTEKTRKDPKRPEKTPEKTQKDPKRHFYC